MRRMKTARNDLCRASREEARNVRRMTLVAGLLIMMNIVCLPAAAQRLGSAQAVLNQIHENTTSIEDLDAVLTVETYEDDVVKLTQKLRLSLLQPSKMRQEYLEPEYLAGNLTLIVDNDMWIYIAAVDTWYRQNLEDLSAAEQPWLVFRQFLREVEDEFDNYTFDLIDDAGSADPLLGQAESHDLYHLAGLPSSEEAAYGRVELWVDPQTFVPTRRILYDVSGNLLVELHILDVERVAESAYLARTMITYDETGEQKSIIRYDTLTVDSGLDPSLFVPEPEVLDE